jgi:hypothetical protein
MTAWRIRADYLENGFAWDNTGKNGHYKLIAWSAV